MDTKQQIIEQIAKDYFRAETLETRNRDSLDFYDAAVWSIKEALSRAYNAGLEMGRSMNREGLSFDWFKESKIVDGEGLPLTVYHGTDRYFEQFDPEYKGSNTSLENTRFGFYFLADKEKAINFAKETCRGDYVVEAYLSIQKPLDLRVTSIFNKEDQAPTIYQIMTGDRLSPSEALECLNEEVGLGELPDLLEALSTDDAKVILEADGFDGVISEFGKGVIEYVAFHPGQIKVLSCYRHEMSSDPLDVPAVQDSKKDLTQ